MKNMRNVARTAILPVAGATLFGCAPIMENQKEWQPTPGTHALGADLLPSMGYYESAVDAINGRHYALALDYLQAARAAKADDVRVLTAFGVVYDKLGRFDLSARYYAQAAAIDPKSAIIAQDVDYSHRLQVLALGPAAPATSSLASNAIESTAQPRLVTERDTAIGPSAGGQIITAVNIPALSPELVSGDVTSFHAPMALAASVAQSDANEVISQPRLVAGREISMVPTSGSQIITAVEIPALKPDIVTGDATSVHALTALTASAGQPDAIEVIVQPRLVAGRDISMAPPSGRQIIARVDIPALRPDIVARDSESPHTAAALTASVVISNASEVVLQPRLVKGRDIAAMPSQGHEISAVIDIPALKPEIVAVNSKPLHPSVALAANLSPVYSARSAMRSMPVSARPVPAVPRVGTHMVATATIPKMWTVNFVATNPQQSSKAHVSVAGRSVVLVGHPLVLVNASGHRDTPASIGRRLSGLGWSVAKSVETAPRVQAKTLIIYQKSKSAAAIALARTLLLTPRLTADKNAVGLRLVLGSDLSSTIFKAHLSPVSGKRIKFADAGHQSRE